jgi:hypothetical protein
MTIKCSTCDDAFTKGAFAGHDCWLKPESTRTVDVRRALGDALDEIWILRTELGWDPAPLDTLTVSQWLDGDRHPDWR